MLASAVTIVRSQARSCKYLTVVGDAEQGRTNSSAMSDKTVLMIRSVEDSLAHWCTLASCDVFAQAVVHQ